MQIPPWLGEDRWHVATGALRFVVEDRAAANRRLMVETIRRRLRSWDSQLIELESRKFGGRQIFGVTFMSEAIPGRNGILFFIIEARIKKSSWLCISKLATNAFQ